MITITISYNNVLMRLYTEAKVRFRRELFLKNRINVLVDDYESLVVNIRVVILFI